MRVQELSLKVLYSIMASEKAEERLVIFIEDLAELRVDVILEWTARASRRVRELCSV